MFKRIFLIVALFSLCLISCENKSIESIETNDNNYVSPFDKEGEVVDSGDVDDEFNFSPFLKDGEDKFTISVVQSGNYINYINSFLGILDAFKELGWMTEGFTVPDEKKDSLEKIIEYLQTSEYSTYMTFPENMFFDFNWPETEEELEQKVNSTKFQDILNSKEVDLIFSLGTTAGKVLSRPKKFDTPVLVASVSDPVASGIIESNEDSGKNYLTAFCDPERFIRQIRLFYDVVKFDKLGILYTDTPNGRTYTALEDIQTVSKEKGFEIVSNVSLGMELIESDRNPNAPKVYLDALKVLAENISNKNESLKSVGAVYLTIQAGLTLDNLPSVMEIINEHKLPSFAMEGSKYVKHGVLFSIATIQETLAGSFNTRKIIRIFKGETPRDLPQIFTVVPSISLNLEEAEEIGYDIPIDILGSSDEVYDKIYDVDD